VPQHIRNRACQIARSDVVDCFILCLMSADFAAIFATVKAVMAEQAGRLAVQKDTPIEYSLVTD
jgi:hypothetical protein